MVKLFELKKGNILVITAVTLLVLITTSAAIYFYLQYQKTATLLSGKNTASDEAKKIIEKVGKLMLLPSDEQPTIATISDREKLVDQPFFARAKNGDKLIVYNNARRAILYDPIANKIIDVAPVNISSPAATTVEPTKQTASLNIALYNGTETVGLTKKAETDLTSAIENLEVILKENAKKKDYAKTLVIDLTGKNKEGAGQIAKTLKGEISSLPAGEEKPVTPESGKTIDILVIVGKDYLK